MKRSYTSPLSVEQCKAAIQNNTSLLGGHGGTDTFGGWTAFGFFSVSLRGSAIRMYNPVFKKALGRITHRNGQTRVSFRIYHGLTDIFSLLYTFLGSMVVLLVVGKHLHLTDKLGLSVLCSLLAALITWIGTRMSGEGRSCEEDVIGLLEQALKLEKPSML